MAEDSVNIFYEKHLFFCIQEKAEGKTCCSRGGQAVEMAVYAKQRLVALGLHGRAKVRVSQSQCLGRCKSGPNLLIYPEGVWYTYASQADIDEIIDSHLVSGQPVSRLLNPPSD